VDKRTMERLGDYRILREVGRGGMGIVNEAEQVSLSRHVTLKVLPSHALLDPKHLQREARAAARLHHTNIAPVYGVGEDAIHHAAGRRE
jgi:serine/threonine protein kinase